MRRARLLFLPIAAVIGLAVSTSAWQGAAADKTIFVTVVDANGKPVTESTAAEFGIKEGGVIREISDAKPSKQQLMVEMLADTTKNAGAGGLMLADAPKGSTGGTKQQQLNDASQRNSTADLIKDIRTSFLGFAHQLAGANPTAMMGLMEFGQAAIPITSLTDKMPDIEKGINRIFPKGDADSVLLEAIIEASNTLAKRQSPRRAIVIINVECQACLEQSQEQPAKIQDSLRKSGASMWAVSLQKGDLKNPARDLVLNALAKNTGGHRDYIVGQSLLEDVLKNYADYLSAQYEVTYKRPAGPAPNNIQIGVARQNVTLYAPLYPPQ